MGSLRADVRYCLRGLRKSPAFAITAVVSLALGIGANTAIFNVLNAVLLRPLPVREPYRLVHISTPDAGLSLPMFEAIESRQTVFSGMFAWWGDALGNLNMDGRLSTGDIWAVTGNFYSELGIRPILGRLLVPSDADLKTSSPAQVAVLGYGLWKRAYGGDPAIVGKTVRVGTTPFTIVGVAPRGFTGMSISGEPDVTVPITAEPLITGHRDISYLHTRKLLWLDVGGRLKEGATLAKARAQLDAMWPHVLADTLPSGYSSQQRQEFLAAKLLVKSGATGSDVYLRSRYTRSLWTLLAITGLIVLIACVNLASLSLSRVASRAHEIGVRVALGASRWQLVRHQLLESFLLSLAGAAGGVALAYSSSKILVSLMTKRQLVPSVLNLTPDLRVLGFTMAVAILTGFSFGLASCWSTVRRDSQELLQWSIRALSGTAKTGKVLIGAQVALSMVLLAGAGLCVRSFQKLLSVDPGFRIKHVLIVLLMNQPDGYKNLDNDSYYPDLLGAISSLPGVQSVSMSHSRPADGFEWIKPVSVAGGPASAARVEANFDRISPQFFRTLGITLLQGRDFRWQDNEHSPRVAILSHRLADRLFRGDPVGRYISVGSDAQHQQLQVVGIVKDVRLLDVRDPNTFAVYVPVLQEGAYAHWGNLEIRTSGAPMTVAAAVRQQIEARGHEYALRMTPLTTVSHDFLTEQRITAVLSGLLGALALGLASIGIYGLMSYAVTKRRREIGIRIALGAQQGSVRWLILGESLFVVMVGLVAGLPCALAATRLISHLLFGIGPNDPLTLTVVACVLIAVGGVAGYLPARRAARVDPMIALRSE